ncbi:DUF664 domain-containing protein [Aeromicrobium chenweiae]|uniref:Mini-circle protein n=1 Tax=Aeromicrobium chenweiae TaxID=2079793 RepID=A0A2S0WKR5_9ACTN|nr:DUF664 domain-containing protein [Aeromicrobium chenweiae]AWB91939.1 Mini-circle protein [Aeromicrobium chenweiae]TGN32791.1 DUF664 domain-containing protein [Aeromicrobium chenweiae]
MSLPEPHDALTDPAARIVDYLDFFRAEVRRQTGDLPDGLLHQVVVPSGWTIPQLVEHLVHMERRWVVWGFLGEQVPLPDADRDADDRWVTDRPLDVLLDALDEGGRRTADVVDQHGPYERARTGGMFGENDELPTLLGILFHVMQEHARHAGHLDIVRELLDGTTGED